MNLNKKFNRRLLSRAYFGTKEEMQKYQTIIIGAGPGGLACAKHLADQGREVLLLEKNNCIGPKSCAGGITHSGLIRHVPEDLIERSFSSQHVFSNLQKTVIRASSPIVSTINRKKLGQYMFSEAQKAGAVIRTNTQVTSIHQDRVRTAEGDFAFENLVGADGSSSLVRRFLNIPVTRIGTGIHFEVPGNFAHMEWHLDAGLFNNGYAWIFPHKDLASIGVYGAIQYNRPAFLLKKFRHWAQKHGITLDGLSPRAALINFDYRGWRFGNIYLVGDAAGLASGLTGEGIYPAIISGRAVADTIINPNFQAAHMEKMLAKHRQHCRMIKLTAKGRITCRVLLESLLLALRLGIIDFKTLEMGN